MKIEVAVALPIYDTFIYSVPEHLIPSAETGKRVLVPFGRRKVTGYILGPNYDFSSRNLKSVLDILDEHPLFPESMIPFFKWIGGYYLHPLGDVIKCALPKGLNYYDYITIGITEKGKDLLSGNWTTPLEKEILSRLKEGPCRLRDIYRQFEENIPYALIYTMQKQGLIIQHRKIRGGTTKPKLRRYLSLKGSGIPKENLSDMKKKIIGIIADHGTISVKRLKDTVPSASRLIKSLEKAGYISIFEKRVYRDPFNESILPDQPHELTREQTVIMKTVTDVLGSEFASFLCTGVTGSGKTEVYMQLAERAIKMGYCVLVLVPEIALISQMERRFRARFGKCIALLHSGLSSGERYDQWIRIVQGDATIAIGARSAIFAPFKNIGVIIVDEEHDASYKQETNLRYNARDLAVVRAKLEKGVALLGSATPSIQSYHNVKTGKFTELTLKKRIEKRPLAKITVVDLRKNRDERGIRRFITNELHNAMKETLDRNEQVLLFLNRRGFAGYSVCALCGEAIRCSHCDIALTLHKKPGVYRCHYCGYTKKAPAVCTACGSSNIKILGMGTEKVETAVKALFPEVRTARMDSDTTRRKGSILKLLKELKNNTINILVGTQMVAKGHDFPNITLVGIICADLSLNFPDFRAGERTFQLLAQVAGRAGRGVAPGRVILQTYNPDHFSVTAATTQDFKTFYNVEIDFRKSLNYPPFSRIAQIKISGKNRDQTTKHAKKIVELCNNIKRKNRYFLNSVEVLGPVEAPVYKIANRYRWQILLKGSAVKPLQQFVNSLWFDHRKIIQNKNVRVVLDIDPFSMM